MQTEIADSKQRLSGAVKWSAWSAVVLSVPLIVTGLWISLAWSEPVYRFVASLRPRRADDPWHAAIVARVIAWIILLLSLLQVVCCGQMLRFLVRRAGSGRARRWVIGAWAQVAVLFVLIAVWLNLMMGLVSLMNGMHDRTPPNQSASRHRGTSIIQHRSRTPYDSTTLSYPRPSASSAVKHKALKPRMTRMGADKAKAIVFPLCALCVLQALCGPPFNSPFSIPRQNIQHARRVQPRRPGWST